LVPGAIQPITVAEHSVQAGYFERQGFVQGHIFVGVVLFIVVSFGVHLAQLLIRAIDIFRAE